MRSDKEIWIRTIRSGEDVYIWRGNSDLPVGTLTVTVEEIPRLIAELEDYLP